MPTTLHEGYPSQYESKLTLKNGGEVFLRPIRDTDGPLLVELFNMLSSQSVYFRFLRPLHALSEDMLYHFTNVNYDSAFALVAVIEEDGEDAIIAVGRYAFDPRENVTDFSVAVRDDWQHLGLGKLLLKKIITIGKEHGIPRFVSMIHSENDAIKKTLRNLGYEVKYSLRSGSIFVELLV
ncbi:MAG: GNAT family N-acetyltransferase [Deltaproteobacteria bacterium]|nr:GNAT family N-acetyltransferase [Deltaproteobacteria bacterium]